MMARMMMLGAFIGRTQWEQLEHLMEHSLGALNGEIGAFIGALGVLNGILIEYS